VENGSGDRDKKKGMIVIRGFHIDPEKDRGVFWILVDDKQVEDFTSLSGVEARLVELVEYLRKKYNRPIGLRVSWELDYPRMKSGSLKSLEECSPSYREKKRAWLEGVKKKKRV
tara:strand:- start:449 stop:790 length:342 start_codon:yes stop_codon:yes gene_type:complete